MTTPNECPICYEDMSSRMAVRSPCGHELCLDCLLRLPTPATCPLCRMSLPVGVAPREVRELVVPLMIATHGPAADAPMADAGTLQLHPRRAPAAIRRIRFVRHGSTMTETEPGLDDDPAPRPESPEAGLYEGAADADLGADVGTEPRDATAAGA